MSKLEVNNVTKCYKVGNQTQEVLSSVTYVFTKNKMTAIMGPSGSGKSTFLNIIGGLQKPSDGTIFFEDEEINFCDEKQLLDYRRDKVGMIFQDFNLVSFLNVEDNIFLPLMVLKKNKKDYYDYYLELSKELQIYEKRKAHISTLSGGEKQRVAILRTLLTKPKLILADEPTGSLDLENTKNFMSLLKRYSHQYNITVIIVTHDKLVETYCDEVLRLEKGVFSKQVN